MNLPDPLVAEAASPQQQQPEEEEEEGAAAAADHFDRLPDELVLFILHKTRDATSLLRCLCLSRRFSSLVPRIRSLHLSLSPPKPHSRRPTSLFHCFSLFFTRLVAKPFKQLFRIRSGPGPMPTQTRVPNPTSSSLKRVLKNFREVESVHVKLPFHAADGFDKLVKWKAEFGRDLKSCVIMGATSLRRIGDGGGEDDEGEEEEEERERAVGGGDDDNERIGTEALLTDRELRMRVVWIISSLVSASARHHFLKQIILSSDSGGDHPRLRSVVMSDGNNQGKVWMGREQLVEMKESLVADSGSNSKRWLERTPVPELSIKMSYVRALELPESRYSMRGATLVEVRAVGDSSSGGGSGGGGGGGGGDCEFDGDGEEVAFGEAVREMLKVKKSYVMTMNAF